MKGGTAAQKWERTRISCRIYTGKKTASRDVSCNGTMRSEMQAPWRRKRIAFRTPPSCPINHGPGRHGVSGIRLQGRTKGLEIAGERTSMAPVYTLLFHKVESDASICSYLCHKRAAGCPWNFQEKVAGNERRKSANWNSASLVLLTLRILICDI